MPSSGGRKRGKCKMKAAEKKTKLINGETWYDTDGNVLHAHGGHMLYWKGGMEKTERKTAM